MDLLNGNNKIETAYNQFLDEITYIDSDGFQLYSGSHFVKHTNETKELYAQFKEHFIAPILDKVKSFTNDSEPNLVCDQILNNGSNIGITILNLNNNYEYYEFIVTKTPVFTITEVKNQISEFEV